MASGRGGGDGKLLRAEGPPFPWRASRWWTAPIDADRARSCGGCWNEVDRGEAEVGLGRFEGGAPAGGRDGGAVSCGIKRVGGFTAGC